MIITSWLSKNRSLQIANYLLEAFKQYIHSTTVHDFRKSHKLVWRNSFFVIKFYSSPEDCGYYSALPNYEDLRYVLCNIVEVLNCRHKYEMSFGFDSERMTFLELFDIDYRLANDYIIESQEEYLNSIEAQLRGTSLI